jgi:flagellar hook-basal body complex protein FliE
MIDAVTNININPAAGVGATPAQPGSKPTGASAFADMLKANVDEVAKLQQDASRAVEDLAIGKSEDVTGVMVAVEKSDLAFKTLLAIRAKLMDAYDEIKNMPI